MATDGQNESKERINRRQLFGDSGHGYKQGASFGELAANTVTGETDKLKKFALKRLIG